MSSVSLSRFQLSGMIFCLVMLVTSGCGPAPEAPPQTGGSTTVPSSDADLMVPPEESKPQVAPQETAAEDYVYLNPLTPEEFQAGTLMLFDGSTMFGWEPHPEIDWKVQDQALTASEGPIGLIMTDVPFADFELTLEFQADADVNSGVFIRCADAPQKPGDDCYEINIAAEHPEGFTTGSLVGLAKETSNPKFDPAGWTALKIRAEGKHIVVTIGEEVVCDFTDDREAAPLKGRIGLQKNAGRVAFRDIRLTPLNRQSLFNGKDLAGWREVPGSKSVFDVIEGTIHVVNGAGFLETEKQFGDFLVQFDAKTNAAELNSGMFFRAMTGTEENPSGGYEVQIHNGTKEGDPNQPNNAGTGAIFRRAEARRVVAKDMEWCTVTLVAAGPKIATWVNGYPVVSWTDEREPNENPRRGLRLEPGHLSLQGHDPTTDLNFRNIQVQEY